MLTIAEKMTKIFLAAHFFAHPVYICGYLDISFSLVSISVKTEI